MVSPFSIATTGSAFATALAAGCGCCAASGRAQATSDKRIIRFMKFLQRESDDAVGNRVTGGGHSGGEGRAKLTSRSTVKRKSGVSTVCRQETNHNEKDQRRNEAAAIRPLRRFCGPSVEIAGEHGNRPYNSDRQASHENSK